MFEEVFDARRQDRQSRAPQPAGGREGEAPEEKTEGRQGELAHRSAREVEKNQLPVENSTAAISGSSCRCPDAVPHPAVLPARRRRGQGSPASPAQCAGSALHPAEDRQAGHRGRHEGGLDLHRERVGGIRQDASAGSRLLSAREGGVEGGGTGEGWLDLPHGRGRAREHLGVRVEGADAGRPGRLAERRREPHRPRNSNAGWAGELLDIEQAGSIRTCRRFT